jgi:transcriptional regulator with XRE-family HTH domain
MSDYLRSREEMRRALAERDMGTVFQLLNKRGGVSLRALGTAVGMTASRVQEIIKGQRRVSSLDVFERIADALEIPGHQLGLAPRAWESQGPTNTLGTTQSPSPTAASIIDPGLPWPWDPAPTVEAIYSLSRSDLMLDRRQAVRTIAVTTGLPLIDPIQRWLGEPTQARPAPGRRPGRIGEDDVARLENAARMFRTWDDSVGGGLARKAVIGQVNDVADMLRDRYSEPITRRLLHVLAELAKIAATMSWDSGMQAAAQKYHVLALQASKPTGDRVLGANILAAMARQLLYLDRPNDALELVRLAQDGSRNHATPKVRAMLYTREAWCYAHLGRIEGFRRATCLAEDTYTEANKDDADPYWISYFDAAELAGTTGGRVLDLTRHDRRHVNAGITYIEQALKLRNRSSLRSFALDQVGLAQLHFLGGNVDMAVQAGDAAVNTAKRTQSDRVRVHLRELYTTSAPYRHVADVASLRDHMRDALAS